MSVSEATPLNEFITRSRSAVTPTYRIGPGDQLTARFYYNPQLDQDIIVRPDGNISLALIGEVRAAGRTARQLSDLLTKAYAQYFVKSTAVVLVRQFVAHRAFTDGQVRRPGQVDIVTGAHTVLECLAASGGVTEDGTLTHIFLIRKLPNQPRPMVVELDLAEVLSGEDLAQDVALMPDDYIFVPRSGAADLNLAMQQYLFRNLNLTTGVGFGVYINLNPTFVNRVLNNPNTPPGTVLPPRTPGMPMMPTPTMPPPTSAPTPMR